MTTSSESSIIPPAGAFLLSEDIYLQINIFNERVYIHLRKFGRNAGGLPYATSKGITLTPRTLEGLTKEAVEIDESRRLLGDSHTERSYFIYEPGSQYPSLTLIVRRVNAKRFTFEFRRCVDGKHLVVNEAGWNSFLRQKSRILEYLLEQLQEFERQQAARKAAEEAEEEEEEEEEEDSNQIRPQSKQRALQHTEKTDFSSNSPSLLSGTSNPRKNIPTRGKGAFKRLSKERFIEEGSIQKPEDSDGAYSKRSKVADSGRGGGRKVRGARAASQTFSKKNSGVGKKSKRSPSVINLADSEESQRDSTQVLDFLEDHSSRFPDAQPWEVPEYDDDDNQ